MNNTKKIIESGKLNPKSHVVQSLKSFARSYQLDFSKNLKEAVEWNLN